jgi:hypothetical protein
MIDLLCLTPLLAMFSDTPLCGKVCQWLTTGRWFSPVLRFPPPIKLTTTYNWNIVESDVKHHNLKYDNWCNNMYLIIWTLSLDVTLVFLCLTPLLAMFSLMIDLLCLTPLPAMFSLMIDLLCLTPLPAMFSLM